jgi:menaquinone-9 beta-reductase
VIYDVIIAGASFAGLAVAAQLRGKRVLLLDRKPVGTKSTSACAVPLQTVQSLGLEQAVRQIHREVTVHTLHTSMTFPLAGAACIVDYRTLCEALSARGDADFVETAAVGVEKGGVRTRDSVIPGRFLVDASGWRAALARSIRHDLVRSADMGLGLETIVPHRAEGLHLWYHLERRWPLEMGWVFPDHDVSHVGLARYAHKGSLKSTLRRFLSERGFECGEVYGGALVGALRPPIIDDLFLVGDAAGQCLPTLGEGIRPALFFGTHLGHLLSATLEGEMTLEAAKATYRRLVEERRRVYRLLSDFQRFITTWPFLCTEALLFAAKSTGAYRYVLGKYEWGMRLLQTTFIPASEEPETAVRRFRMGA